MTAHIDRIEVENFKSYKGRHTIGPFRRFTAVVGPNGAGKSNLMDAISFVVGVETNKLRGHRMEDMINVVSSIDQSGKCFVKLILVNADDEEVTFQRSIKVYGTKYAFEYRYNDTVVSSVDYKTQLAEFSIVVKTPNCLVFQGEVEGIARKSPKELTALIEQVSGSEEFKEDYERLDLESKSAAGNLDFLTKQRKGLVSERKDYNQQKREADEHQRATEEWKELKMQHALFQLYYLSQDMESIEGEMSKKRTELATLNARIDQDRRGIVDRRKAVGELQLKFSSAQNKLEQQEAKVNNARTEVAKTEKEREHNKKRVLQLEKELVEAEKKQEEASRKISELENDLAEINEAERVFEEEYDAGEVDNVKLKDSQMKELAQIKEKARGVMAEERLKLAQLEREQAVALSSLVEVFEPRHTEIEKKLAKLRNEDVPSLTRRVEGLEAAHNSFLTEKINLTAELETIQVGNQGVTKEQDRLQEELNKVQEQLRNARIDMSDTERRSKMEECLDSLKRLFPGVYGRIFDLVVPSHDKYKISLTVVLGSNIDSIVVADRRTALECIQYMKEQRVGVATFIPLDSVKSSVSYDRLRLLEPGVIKPIIDVLNYDPQYQAAVEYVCGNTLICQDLDKAREWAFQHGQKRKVCTIDGVLISKSGLMSGGGGGIAAKAKRWDQKHVSELKNKRDDFVTKLNQLHDQLRNVSKERDLQTQLQNVSAKLYTIEVDLNLANGKLQSILNEISKLETELANKVQPEYNALKKSTEKRAPKIQELLTQIGEAEDAIYSDFGDRVGIANIREWEVNRKNRLRLYAEKKLIYTSQRSRIANLLKYVTEKDETKIVAKLKDELVKENLALTAAEDEVTKHVDVVNELKETLEKMREEFESTKKTLKTAENKLKESSQDTETRVALSNSMTKLIGSKEAALTQLKSRRHQVYSQCQADDIHLPILEGEASLPKTLSERMDVDGSTTSHNGGVGSSLGRGSSSLGLGSREGSLLAQTQEMDSQSVQNRLEEEAKIKVDFRKLPGDHKKCQTHAQSDEKNQMFLAEISTKAARIDAGAPNYKAVESLTRVNDHITDLDEQIETAKKVSAKTLSEFREVRLNRNRAFTDAFTQISNEIGAIYKKLTGGFGVAHLTLDSTDEPYLFPTRYSAVPRYKTFREMEDLSGGEKSMAALALLFAIHSCRPSPFFVLDEVDAALDFANVTIVADYFREKSKDVQFIVISLKENCFHKADMLVGVYLDKPHRTSKSVTLDLTPYADVPKHSTKPKNKDGAQDQ